MKYTLALLFNKERDKILLILKNRPVRQAGLYNALGGKVEPNENVVDSIRREVREEGNIDIPTRQWEHFATLHSQRSSYWQMFIFRAFGDIELASQGEDQPLGIFPVNTLPENIMPNLHWLVPMALHIEKDGVDYFEMYEAFNYGK